jgi:hypothetical protein
MRRCMQSSTAHYSLSTGLTTASTAVGREASPALHTSEQSGNPSHRADRQVVYCMSFLLHVPRLPIHCTRRVYHLEPPVSSDQPSYVWMRSSIAFQRLHTLHTAPRRVIRHSDLVCFLLRHSGFHLLRQHPLCTLIRAKMCQEPGLPHPASRVTEMTVYPRRRLPGRVHDRPSAVL